MSMGTPRHCRKQGSMTHYTNELSSLKVKQTHCGLVLPPPFSPRLPSKHKRQKALCINYILHASIKVIFLQTLSSNQDWMRSIPIERFMSFNNILAFKFYKDKCLPFLLNLSHVFTICKPKPCGLVFPFYQFCCSCTELPEYADSYLIIC